ncbi:TOMM precursor leader peptide-binding protein [Nocardiopsis kunsanensis]|uniref:TOMM precursor leader peptide-binding protein n=1 Tax=Nocardiopsis kunsanensis TaxID=141693 RepID=UPI00034CB8F7|nr:TOMM precursor leader peptide-binding protein [Nocardiopsis kunsanensis]
MRTDRSSCGRRVGLVGSTDLASRIAAVLDSSAAEAVLLAPGRPDHGVEGLSAVVHVSATPDEEPPGPARAACTRADVPWYSVRPAHDGVHAGPLSVPGRPGCERCAVERHRRADRYSAHRADAVRHDGEPARLPAAPLMSGSADTVARVVVHDVLSRLDRSPVDAADGFSVGATRSFLRMGLDGLATSRHRFLPDPECTVCGGLPDDGPGGTPPGTQPVPKRGPRQYRVRDVTASHTELLSTYVDARAGFVRSLRLDHGGPLVRAMAQLSSSRGHEAQQGWGRGTSALGSRVTAVLEALERFGGERPGGRRTVVRAAYEDVADQALDPRTLGLYPEERYAGADLPFARYREDLVLPWVWGRSLTRGEPVLVPERYAYYAAHSHEEPRFVYEVSNGCALGGCPEEAVLHGLLEVAERDAFLMTWYARLPVPRLDVSSLRDPVAPMLVEHLQRETGYDITLYCPTMEQRIPCFWAMAVDRAGDPLRPRTLCVGGSSLAPELGVRNVLFELSHLLERRKIYDADARERAAAMVREPDLVRVMDDHSLLYCHEDAFYRFGFLTGSDRVVSLDELNAHCAVPAHEDLAEDLAELVRRYEESGLEVIAVDQTAPEHAAGGFTCVKVIVPGALPMTFGHRNRRTDGLPRLGTVPATLGYREGALVPEDVNPHPHPFP